MSTTAENLADPQLLEAAWDLSALVDGDEENGVTRQLDEALERATAFAETYAGKLAELDRSGLATAMHELAAINELVGKAGSFASLRFCDRHRRRRAGGAAATRPGARRPRSRPSCCSSSWSGRRCPTSAPRSCSPTSPWPSAAHYLRSARRYRPHLLSEPEETILAEKSIARQSAWARLFGELVAALRVPSTTTEAAARRRAEPASGSRPGHRAGRSPRRCRGRWSPGCAPARSSTTHSRTTRRSRIGCAPTRTGWRRATSPTRPPTSR